MSHRGPEVTTDNGTVASPELAQHWDNVFSTNPVTDLSWYQWRPTASLTMLDAAGIAPDAAVIDVGGGASTLVDALLERGFRDVTVLDISPAALTAARTRLSPCAGASWIAADLLQWQPTRQYDVWHDRAVFHFLTEPADRDRYRRALSAALRPGGLVVIGTFSPRGPDSCSGLRAVRYDADQLAGQLGVGFQVVASHHEPHVTPADRIQEFTWLAARRTAG